MNTARTSHADRANAGAGLASWYTPGRTDGFGDRLLMSDNTGGSSMELLRFRRELASAPGFEDALRERSRRLQRFRHPAFAAVRAVEHLEGGEGLTLVSTYTAGQRLSELFVERPRAGRAGLHPGVVTWLLRELIPALAALQAEGPDVVHGAVTADRIVLTPEGRLCIVEHVMGSAMQRLNVSQAVLWRELNVLAPAYENGRARIDASTDIVQLAAVALGMLLGRPVTLNDLQHRLRALLDEFSASPDPRASQYIPPLRLWLERALQVNGRGYGSAAEAQEALKELPAGSRTARPSAVRRSLSSGDAAAETPASDTARLQSGSESVPAKPASETERAPAPAPDVHVATPPSRRRMPAIATMLGAVVVVEAAIIAYLVARPVPAASPASVVIESARAGDVVMVNGEHAGTTPLQIQVPGDIPSIRVVASGSATGPAAAPVSVAAQAERRTPDVVQAAAPPRSGGIRISAPFELTVLEGNRVLGSTADGAIVAPAGTHTWELVNTTVGYRVRQSVTVRAGQVRGLTVTPPSGRVSINAQPWAQVWIDQTAVGETPLANVPVALGEHQVTFRHPQFGERRERVIVRADAPARVSATFER